MKKKKLEYNFHDSTIISCEQEKDDKFVLTLQLYEIFYPLKENVRILFSGVFNQDKVSRLFEELKMDCLEPDWNGSRVNSLTYDSKKVSKDIDLYVFVDINGFEQIRIHCKKIRIEKINLNK